MSQPFYRKVDIFMKMTNAVLVGFINALSSFEEKKLPQKISYAITRNMIVAQKEYGIYESQLKKIIKDFEQFIIKDDDDKPIFEENGLPKIVDSEKENFAHEINDLMGVEIDFDLYNIDISAFDYEDSERFDPLSPADIMLLQSMICKTEE